MRELFYAIQHKLRKSPPNGGNIDKRAPDRPATPIASLSIAPQCQATADGFEARCAVCFARHSIARCLIRPRHNRGAEEQHRATNSAIFLPDFYIPVLLTSTV